MSVNKANQTKKKKKINLGLAKGNKISLFCEIYFFISVLCLIGYIFYAVVLCKTEFSIYTDAPEKIDKNITVTFANGSNDIISLPYKTPESIPGYENLTLSFTLPEIPNDSFFSFRMYRQECKVYVGQSLRADLTMSHDYIYRSETYSRYAIIPINKTDGHKQIRIVFNKHKDGVRYYNTFLIGSKDAIMAQYLSENIADIVLGIIFGILGVVCVIFGFFLRISTHGDVKIDYIGWASLMVTLLNIFQSPLRDFLFSNIKTISIIPSMTIILLPISIGMYINSIQKKRYIKLYIGVFIICIVNYIFWVFLQLLRKADLMDALPAIASTTFLIELIVLITFVLDHKHGNIKDYSPVVIGFICLVIVSFYQVVSNLLRPLGESVIPLLTGVSILNICCAVFEIKGISKFNTEKRLALSEAETKTQFLANMSHEIRTPINAILGMNETILRESHEKDIISYASDVDSAGHMLLTIINDILDFSKLDNGKMTLTPMEYNLRNTILSSYNLITKKAEDKNLKVVMDIDENLPSKLYGDEVRIQQILTNILNNAVKYTDEGRVGFKVFFDKIDDKNINLKLFISDTGIGIKESDKHNLFNAFERLDEKRNRKIEGTGLGLAITGQLVKLMNGTITVESTYGSGSVFMISIPQEVRSDKPIGKLTPDSPSEHLVSKANEVLFTAPHAKILVVDDVAMNLKVATSLLKNTQIQVDTVSSGLECLEHCKKTSYHVILLDHMMPNMDGIETFRELRKDRTSKNCDTPVVMLTANAIAGVREQYIDEGFTDYLSKPFSSVELQRVLLKLIPKDVLLDQSPVEDESTRLRNNESDADDAVHPLDLSFINRAIGLSNYRNNEVEYKKRIERFANNDFRTELLDSFSKTDYRSYMKYINVIVDEAMGLGIGVLSPLVEDISKAFETKDYKLLESTHRSLMKKYSEIISTLLKALDHNIL